jgi:hypothetical protein
VTDLNHEHDDALIFNTANQSVVLYAIAPQASQVAAQRFAESPGVLSYGDAFTQIAQDGLLDFGVEFAQLAPSTVIEFDGPGLTLITS